EVLDGSLEPLAGVADHQPHALEAARHHLAQQAAPALFRLPEARHARQYLPEALLTHTDRHQHAHSLARPTPAHAQADAVQVEVGIRPGERPLPPLPQPRRQPPAQPAHRCRAHALAGQGMSDARHPARAHPFHVRPPERLLQRRLHPPVALEDPGPERPRPLARHPQLDLAHPGPEPAAVAAVAVAAPARGPLAPRRPQVRRELGLQDLLQHRLHRCAHLRFDPGPVVLGTEQLRPRPFGLDLDSVRFPAGRTHGAPPVSGGVQQPLLPETRGSVRFYTEEGTLPFTATFLCSLLAGGPVAAQQTTGRIQGRVTDAQTGQRLVGASVIVVGTNYGNITNEEGYYFINNVPAGVHDIQAQFLGYRTVVVEAQRVLAGQTADVSFELTPEALALEAITVQGERNPLVPRRSEEHTSELQSREN